MDPHSFIARAEAQRWLGIAEKLLMGHDLVGSKTFAIRARDSDPRLEAADQILAITDTLLAADKRVVANNGTQQPDYYAILQLVRFVQDTEHIASQYRRLAVRLNPHQNRFPYSDQAFQLVNDAWAVLSNPMRKSMYDAELDFQPQQQMNPIGFNLEQHHHQQHHHHQQQHNFFSINHMGSGHEQELPEQPQTFQTRVQHQQQQLQQHNFLSQPNPVRPLPIREQEQLFQHRDQEQMFQPQVQPFQVTSVAQQQTRPSPQPPQPQPIQSPPPASPHPPFSWPQAAPLSQSQHQPEPHKQKQNLQPQPQLEPQKQKQHLQPQPQLEPHKQKQHLQPQPKLEPHKQKQHLQPQSQSQPQPQPKPHPQHVQPQPQPQQHVQPQPQLQHHLQAQPLPQQQHPWEKNQQQQQPQLPQERNQQQQQPQQLPHKQNQQQPQQQQELPQVQSQPQPQPQQLHQEKSPQQLEPQQRPQEQPHQPLTRKQRQQQEQQQQKQQESLEKNDSPVQLPSQVTGNNGVRDEEVETETEAAAENVDDSPTFWTACPYCFYMFEYPKVYAECTLRCDNCKRAFQAVSVPSPPAIIEGQEACFYCWGFFPLGVSMSHLEKNNGKGTSSSWTPFSPLYDTSSNAQDHLNGRAAPKEKFFVHKNSGPRIHIDDITDDAFMGISDSSDGSSDTEWDSTRENKVKRMKKGLEQGYKKRKQVLAVKPRDTRNGSVKDLQHAIPVEEGVGVPVPVPVTESNKKAVGSNPPRRQSGRIAKELGKLDLNVEFNHNEGEEAAPRLSVGNRGHGQGDEDNIEGIGFFEGLDEFLSSLPILSVVNDEKVKAA